MSEVKIYINQPNYVLTVKRPGVAIDLQRPALTFNILKPANSISITRPAHTISIDRPAHSIYVRRPAIKIEISRGLPGPPGSGGSGATIALEAGEDIAAKDLICVGADGLLYRADANDIDKEATGVAIDAIASGDTGTVYLGDKIVAGLSGLTPGKRQYLSATVAGGFTDSIAAVLAVADVSGGIVQQIGRSISSTILFVSPLDSIYAPALTDTGITYRITESGDQRVTESGDIRIIDTLPITTRLTESGDTRITEAGDARITE